MIKGGMGNLMKQAQQMQEKMQKAQEELANAEVTGESGAGLVESHYDWPSRRKKRSTG